MGKKKPEKKPNNRLKSGRNGTVTSSKLNNVCEFCNLSSDKKSMKQMCPKVCFHKECMIKKLRQQSSIEITCGDKLCPQYNAIDDGHVRKYTPTNHSHWKGKWRKVTTNLLLFSLSSVLALVPLGGNRPNGNNSPYNYIPPYTISFLFVCVLSHMVTFGWEGWEQDLKSIASLLLTAVVFYFDIVPHFYEFLLSCASSSGCIITYYTVQWLLLCLGKKGCHACSACRDCFIQEGFEESE